MDFDGLAKAAEELLAGIRIAVNVRKFQNDLVSFHSRDDVLTLLIHFGYLSYAPQDSTVRIPNEEIRIEFADMIRDVSRKETIRRVRESDRLILDTINQNEEAVAMQIEKIQSEEFTLMHYNNEQSLRKFLSVLWCGFTYFNGSQ